MCEHYVARAAEPFRLDELWPFTERLERFGIAGFGWGAAWLGGDGAAAQPPRRAGVPRRPRRPGARRRRARPRAALVHLRRPSKLSTLDLPDTQPFDDPAGRYSFSHNGDLRDYRALRATYRAGGPDPRPGRHRGRARAGSRTRGATTSRSPHLLAALHDRFGGQANLAVLTADGTPHHYAGNGENPVFTFRLGRIGLASTGIYSLDRSLFRFVAPRATERRLVRQRSTVALDRNGSPAQAF